jgi:archaellum component FlaC
MSMNHSPNPKPKAIITVKRLTEYSSIVEMQETTFNRIAKDLEGGRVEVKRAEKELDRLIDTKDWQDDEFSSLEGFEKFEEGK